MFAKKALRILSVTIALYVLTYFGGASSAHDAIADALYGWVGPLLPTEISTRSERLQHEAWESCEEAGPECEHRGKLHVRFRRTWVILPGLIFCTYWPDTGGFTGCGSVDSTSLVLWYGLGSRVLVSTIAGGPPDWGP